MEWPVKWKWSTLMWRHHNAFKHPNMPHTQPMIYKNIESRQTRLKFCIYASGPTITFKQNGIYVPWLQTLICDFQPQTFTEKTIPRYPEMHVVVRCWVIIPLYNDIRYHANVDVFNNSVDTLLNRFISNIFSTGHVLFYNKMYSISLQQNMW